MSAKKPKYPVVKTAADLQSAARLRVEPLDVDPWKKSLHVRELRADEADIWKRINANLEAGNGFVPADVIDLCLLSICDAEGNSVHKPEGRAELAKMAWAGMQVVFMKALDVGRMSAQGVDDEKKESSPAESPDSSTD